MILAHGPAPDPGIWFLQWAFEPLVWGAGAASAWWYIRAARRVHGWSVWRSRSYIAGIGVAVFALSGPPAVFDTALFWVHMVQHLLLVMLAAPLLLLGAPVTLALRSESDRLRRRLRALIEMPPIKFFGQPVVAWMLMAAVVVLTHFSAIYNAALENELVHIGEHALYISAALLFWWPVVGLDPGSSRLARPVRVVYVALTMPVQAFVGLALYSADRVLYEHYSTLQRSWGPTPLADQQLAGVVMWIGGELLAGAALAAVVVAWMREEDRLAAKEDRRLGLT